MSRLALAAILALSLTIRANADSLLLHSRSEEYAVTVVVNHLRMRLEQSDRCQSWRARYADWWTVWDLRPHEGFW